MVEQGSGIGVSDFKSLKVRNNYYIDKTMYIKDIIDDGSRVIVVIRDKKLKEIFDMKMLKSYFDCRQKNNKELFKEQKILEQGEKYTSKLGAYLVIYISLKNVKGKKFKEMMLALKNEFAKLYKEYIDILENEKIYEFDKERFKAILNLEANDVDIINALKLLMRLLYQIYEIPIILLLDDYDIPLQKAYLNGYYKEVEKFFTRLYTVTFKDNPFLEQIIITGECKTIDKNKSSGGYCFRIYEITDKSNTEVKGKDYKYDPLLVINYYQ